MNEEFHFLRVKTLSKETTRAASNDSVILNVLKHNLREIYSEWGVRESSKIDPLRICQNVLLYGLDTAASVAAAACEAMRAAGIVKARKNAAFGIEVLASLPMTVAIDRQAYFSDAVQWSKQYFDVPMLSAVVHMDEDYPHVHIVMLAVRGGKLVASALLGNRAATKAMHADFHEKVGQRYGLRLPSQQKPLKLGIPDERDQ